MPIHDWTRVDAGIFHHFHQGWIFMISEILNRRVLPGEYYALFEQQGAGCADAEVQIGAGIGRRSGRVLAREPCEPSGILPT